MPVTPTLRCASGGSGLREEVTCRASCSIVGQDSIAEGTLRVLPSSPAISPAGAHESCVFTGRRAPGKDRRAGFYPAVFSFLTQGRVFPSALPPNLLCTSRANLHRHQTRRARDPFIHLFPPVGAVLHQLQGFPANQPSWPANHGGHQTRPARLLYPADGKTGDVDHDHRPSYTEGSGGRSSDASPRTRAGDVKKGERQVILTGSSMVIFPSLLLIPSCRNNEFHRFILNSQLNKILLDKTEHMCYY